MESGTHEELLAIGGVYANLINLTMSREDHDDNENFERSSAESDTELQDIEINLTDTGKEYKLVKHHRK